MEKNKILFLTGLALLIAAIVTIVIFMWWCRRCCPNKQCCCCDPLPSDNPSVVETLTDNPPVLKFASFSRAFATDPDVLAPAFSNNRAYELPAALVSSGTSPPSFFSETGVNPSDFDPSNYTNFIWVGVATSLSYMFGYNAATANAKLIVFGDQVVFDGTSESKTDIIKSDVPNILLSGTLINSGTPNHSDVLNEINSSVSPLLSINNATSLIPGTGPGNPSFNPTPSPRYAVSSDLTVSPGDIITAIIFRTISLIRPAIFDTDGTQSSNTPLDSYVTTGGGWQPPTQTPLPFFPISDINAKAATAAEPFTPVYYTWYLSPSAQTYYGIAYADYATINDLTPNGILFAVRQLAGNPDTTPFTFSGVSESVQSENTSVITQKIILSDDETVDRPSDTTVGTDYDKVNDVVSTGTAINLFEGGDIDPPPFNLLIDGGNRYQYSIASSFVPDQVLQLTPPPQASVLLEVTAV